MKKYIFLSMLALGLASAYAQKPIYDANAELRSVGSFNAIAVSGGIDLYLSSGGEAVAVSAKDVETRNHIRTVVEDGVLKISLDGKGFNFSGNKQLKAYVSYKTLDKLVASGGCDVNVQGKVSSGSLTMILSGGSDFKGNVELETLKIQQSGGSDVNISGTASVLKISASGGSDLDGYELVSEKCEVSASGGSDVHITVNKELKADASGASDILYHGSATVVESRKSGASDVRKS
jgi:hypothetical protein